MPKPPAALLMGGRLGLACAQSGCCTACPPARRTAPAAPVRGPPPLLFALCLTGPIIEPSHLPESLRGSEPQAPALVASPPLSEVRDEAPASPAPSAPLPRNRVRRVLPHVSMEPVGGKGQG